MGPAKDQRAGDYASMATIAMPSEINTLATGGNAQGLASRHRRVFLGFDGLPPDQASRGSTCNTRAINVANSDM